MTIRCHECGTELKLVCTLEFTYRVNPCPECLKNAKNKGIIEGKKQEEANSDDSYHFRDGHEMGQA